MASAKLWVDVHGDLDFAPAEYATVRINGVKLGNTCSGGPYAWVGCFVGEDVTGKCAAPPPPLPAHPLRQHAAGGEGRANARAATAGSAQAAASAWW